MRRHKTAGCWRFATALCGLTVLLPMGAAPVQAEDMLRFGASLSLTGSLSTEVKRVKAGYDFYVKLINDQGGIDLCGKKYKMEIKYYDDESQANTAVRLVERLITEDGIKFLLGPYGSGATLAASTVAEQHQVPTVIAHGALTPSMSAATSRFSLCSTRWINTRSRSSTWLRIRSRGRRPSRSSTRTLSFRNSASTRLRAKPRRRASTWSIRRNIPAALRTFRRCWRPQK